MVLVHPPPQVPIPSVTVENIEITTIGGPSHRSHGKRRILFLRGPIHQEDSMRREAGYRAALDANQIDEDLILNGDLSAILLMKP
jgi:DNA-binding LacI/PurR family transcriptional regulator